MSVRDRSEIVRGPKAPYMGHIQSKGGRYKSMAAVVTPLKIHRDLSPYSYASPVLPYMCVFWFSHPWHWSVLSVRVHRSVGGRSGELLV
jgi:hypothetical protein